MPSITHKKSIYFNDVNILPQCGVTASRKDVPNELYRVIVSPMLSVVGEKFVEEAVRLGLSICSPRFTTVKEKIKFENLFVANRQVSYQRFFTAIGLNESIDDLNYLSQNIHEKNILFDIANGYIPQIKERVDRVQGYIGSFDSMMIGNVVTKEGLDYLERCFKNNKYGQELFIRVGIGNGGPCATSDETGINRGQITELEECWENIKLEKTRIVSDGGIYKPGYACKAWAAGADYVLMGGYFSNAKEAETHISGDGFYYGCASDLQNRIAGLDKHSEGKVVKVDVELKPLHEIVKQLWGGISSYVTYSGQQTLSGTIGKGLFEIKENSLPPRKRSSA
jgi:GMP reductase